MRTNAIDGPGVCLCLSVTPFRCPNAAQRIEVPLGWKLLGTREILYQLGVPKLLIDALEILDGAVHARQWSDCNV